MKKNKMVPYNSIKHLKLFLSKWILLSSIFIYFGCSDVTSPPDVTAPDTPQNFTLLGGGDGQARLRWTKSAEKDLQFYRIYRAVNSNSFLLHTETSQNEYLDRFLSYDSTYYYYLVAVDYAENESDPTYIIDVQPLNISAPQPPTYLIVSGINNPIENRKFINLTWLPPDAGDLDFYKIYRSAEEDFQISRSNLIDSTNIGTYFDNFVDVGQTYFYKISAVDIGKKESLPSLSNSDLILNSAQLQSPSNNSEFTSPFKFQWKEVENAVAYQVFIGNSPFAEVIWESKKVKTNEATYNGSKLASTKVYYWWVGSYSRDKITVDNGNEIEPQINSYSNIGSFVGE